MSHPRSLNLNRLNPPQREAVLHGSGPLLVLAGAGSGKTSTMSYRIAHLVSERRQTGHSILGLSFTKKAAAELSERVRKLVTEVSGPQAARGLTLATFHGLCVRFLREHATKLGYGAHFTIFDQNDQVDLMRQILRSIKVDDKKFDPSAILFEIGQAKNRFLSGDAALEHFAQSRLGGEYADITQAAYVRYIAQIKALDAMDFDDLLFQAVRLLEQHPDVRAVYGARFKHLLVDEYQDTNPAQFRLLRLLTETHQNLCVVGDDDQSIYGWRGADAKHILEFTHHYPGARVITLDQNYRSTARILGAANQVISHNRHRHAKTLWSQKGDGEPIQMTVLEEDRAEAEFVGDEILKRARENREGVTYPLRPWKDFAILYRSNPQSRLFEEALRMRKIPYKLVGALSYLDRKEVKDLLSYWRLVVNQKDDASARRVINWPTRGVGRTALEALNEEAVRAGSSFFEATARADLIVPKAFVPVSQFRSLVLSLRADLERTPCEPGALADWGRRSLEKIGFKTAVLGESDDANQAMKKIENVDELANALGQMSAEDLRDELGDQPLTAVTWVREFLSRLLVSAQEEEDKKKDEDKEAGDQVTLLTLHGSKGLEFPIVFMVGMEDGLLPHRRTIEEGTDLSEERRLCYVGITRAKDHLILTRCRTRVRYGKAVPRVPSRFLNELPQEQMMHLNLALGPDHPSVSSVAAAAAEQKHEERVKSFLDQVRAQISAPPPRR